MAHITLITLLVICFCNVHGSVAQNYSEVQEYCSGETFHANCPELGKVIRIKSAHFGRMRIGGCVKLDHGHLGCSADVKHIADGHCSGQPICEIHIPTSAMNDTRPCPRGFTSYLEISYECVAGKRQVEKYCPLETFNPRCPNGEVIKIKSARFGRMRQRWHCNASDPGPRWSTGCSVDVHTLVAGMCSDRQECEIHLPHSDLDRINPCTEKLKSDLEVSYECTKDVTGLGGEYCFNEKFHPKCQEGEVIIIKNAHYGRMRIGRCIKEDFGSIGCYRDVYSIVSKNCSGQQECEIEIPNIEFDDPNPCHEDAKGYLEVSHECVTVRPQHVCDRQVFHPKCPDGEAILIQSARYGRMKFSPCTRRNYGYIGCSADVHNIVSRRCSGHSECRIGLPDGEMMSRRNCPRYLKMYLEVSYVCILYTNTDDATPSTVSTTTTTIGDTTAPIPSVPLQCYNCLYHKMSGNEAGDRNCVDQLHGIPKLQCLGKCGIVYHKLNEEDYTLTRMCIPNCQDYQDDTVQIQCCQGVLCNSGGSFDFIV